LDGDRRCGAKTAPAQHNGVTSALHRTSLLASSDRAICCGLAL